MIIVHLKKTLLKKDNKFNFWNENNNFDMFIITQCFIHRKLLNIDNKIHTTYKGC